MRDARRAGAFFSGLLLYCAAIGIAIVLAGFRVPRALAAQLGGANSVSVIAVQAAVVALVLFLLALPWAYASVKPRGKSWHLMTSWFSSGIGLAWLAWLLVGVFTFATEARSYPVPLGQLLMSSDTPPLWGLQNIFAVLLATVLAARLARRFNPAPPSSRAGRAALAAAAAARPSTA